MMVALCEDIAFVDFRRWKALLAWMGLAAPMDDSASNLHGHIGGREKVMANTAHPRGKRRNC